jgi:hypothetical protein
MGWPCGGRGMTNDIHAERRDPEQPQGAFDLIEAA